MTNSGTTWWMDGKGTHKMHMEYIQGMPVSWCVGIVHRCRVYAHDSKGKSGGVLCEPDIFIASSITAVI